MPRGTESPSTLPPRFTHRLVCDYYLSEVVIEPPSELTSFANGGFTEIFLHWADNSNNELGFEIERSTDGINYVVIDIVGANVTTYLDTNLSYGQIYYYKVRAFIGLNYSLYSNETNSTVFDISNVSGLYAWYKSDTEVYTDLAGSILANDNDTIALWKDQSGNGFDVIQGTSGARPLYKTNQINGISSIRFASGDVIKAVTASDWTFLHNGNDFLFIIIWKSTSNNPNTFYVVADTGAVSSADRGFCIFFDDNPRVNTTIAAVAKGGAPWSASGVPTNNSTYPGNWHITSAYRRSGGNFIVNNDGHWGGDDDSGYITPSASSPTSALTIGGRYNNTSNLVGDIAEVLIFNQSVSSDNYKNILDYFTEKFDRKTIKLFGIESVVTNDGGHNAFPSVCLAQNGDIITAYRKGSGHSTGDGILVVRRSQDGGNTWLPEQTILSNASWSYYYCGLTTLSNGEIIGLVGKRTSTQLDVTNGVTFIKSTDNGVTWSSEIDITNSFTSWAREGGRIIEMPNGDLLCPMYGQNSGDGVNRRIKISKSIDGGLTWSDFAQVASAIAQFNEPGLFFKSNGDLGCLIRRASTQINLSTSSDDGASWTAETNIMDNGDGLQNPTTLSNGVIASLMRTDSSATIVVLMTSLDDGVTWQMGHIFANSPSGTEMVYGNVVEDSDGTIYSIYATEDNGAYLNGSIGSIMFAKTL